MANDIDVLIVGGGHNGLVAAFYLVLPSENATIP